MGRASVATMIGAAFLASCAQQPDPELAQNAAALANVQSQLAQVESQLKQLQDNTSAGDWVLWASWGNLHNSLSFGWPTAQSAYPTKESCLAAAGNYTFTKGKTILVSTDPYMIRNGSVEYTYRCLPRGVKPLLGK